MLETHLQAVAAPDTVDKNVPDISHTGAFSRFVGAEDDSVSKLSAFVSQTEISVCFFKDRNQINKTL